MTAQEREEIFSKDYLDKNDIMKLLGVPEQGALKTIREIRRVTDRLHTEGKIHTQDYIDYYKVNIERYIFNKKGGNEGGDENDNDIKYHRSIDRIDI